MRTRRWVRMVTEAVVGAPVGHTRLVAGDGRSRRPGRDEDVESRLPSAAALGDVRDPLPREIRDPSFPAAVRGYDRHAVDAYVERVNRLIAELEVSGSPRAAVRHALDRIGEQTSGILQRARETAEEITTTAREEAEATTARARAEAADITGGAQREAGETTSRAAAEADKIVGDARAEADDILVRAKDQSDHTIARARIEAEGRTRRADEEVTALHEQAEARMRSLQADIAAISDERRTLLGEVHRIAARLEEIVVEAAEADAVPEAATNGGEAQNRRPEAAAPGP